MATVKTAISIKEPLFEQVETLASELNISRSRIFALAVEEFIQRYKNQQILEEINRAYDDLAEPAEELNLNKMRQGQRKLLEGEW